MIRAVVVDDEPLARETIRVRLADQSDIELIAEAADGHEAVEKIAELKPDLVFLDVQMPEMTGFEVLDRVAARHLPVIVFVTAHDQFAVRAFESHALDYLLKPFTRERFGVALERARAELVRAEPHDPARVAALLEEHGRDGAAASSIARRITRFVVKEGDRFLLVPADEVEWIESAGNYAQLHTRGRTHLVRETMKELEARLDPESFARVHRRAIVQIGRVREIRPEPQGDFEVVLEGGAVVRMSRNFRGRLLGR